MRKGINRILEVIGNCVLIGSGIVFFFQFVTIKLFGWYGYEPNNLILWVEIIALGVAVPILGLNRFFQDFRRWGRKGGKDEDNSRR